MAKRYYWIWCMMLWWPAQARQLPLCAADVATQHTELAHPAQQGANDVVVTPSATAPAPATPYGDEPERKKPKSWKKKGIAIALCAGLGWAGVHRYYLGAKKPWLTPGYMVLNIVLWMSDLFTLIADRDGMDRFYFTNRLFAAFNL